MKVFLVDITTRKGDGDCTLGPYSSFEKAQGALKDYFSFWDLEELENYKEFDSDFSKGWIFTEEKSAEIYERELE